MGEEAGADRPVLFELVVMIFGNAAAELEEAERSADRDVDAQVDARLATV